MFFHSTKRFHCIGARISFQCRVQLITDEYPTLVKFHEKWCTRCQSMKRAFEYAASQTLGKVMFMEVCMAVTVL